MMETQPTHVEKGLEISRASRRATVSDRQAWRARNDGLQEWARWRRECV